MQNESNNHVFTSGIKDSLDISKLKNTTWAFPTLNIRLLNKDGQGYIITPLKGNTINSGTSSAPVIGGVNNTGSVFRVAANYIIIAAKEFNGVLYIASAINTGTGQGEIGVYPAPNVLITNPTTGVTPSQTGWPTSTTTYPFGRFYAPLRNYNLTQVTAPTFDVTETYAVGDYVEYTDPATNAVIIWICHTGVGPGAWTGVANWTAVVHIYTDTYTLGYTVAAAPAAPGYPVNNIVIYNNHTYTCVVDTGVFPGAFTPAEWTISSTFNTTLFDFTFINMLELELRPHYDNSVNIYMVDYTNPNRVINSGFDMTTGSLTDTIYEPASFYSVLNQIMGTSKELTISDISIVPSGAHKYGNYFFYLKYVNASLDKTDVVCASNACQIYDGDVAQEYTVQGGDPNSTVYPYSAKKVMLQLDTTTIDTSFSYIDVIYTRYYGDPSGVQLWETYEIVQPYLIDDILAAGGIIEIIGDEPVVNVDEAEILRVRGVENICKTQIQFGNRWWGGNWKGPVLQDDELTDFAKTIKISFYDLENLYGTTTVVSGASVHRANPVYPTDTAHGQYDDYHKTYDYVGYFRGEPYVFGVVFELTTGQETEAYPLNGVDNYDDLSLLAVPAQYDPATTTRSGNYEGRYRFPNTEHSSPYRGVADAGTTANDTLHILGVKFDTSAAVTFLATAVWIPLNVRGMYFVRMDRYECLKYQGITLPGSKSYLCYDNGVPPGPLGNTPIEYTFGDPLNAPTFNISWARTYGALRMFMASGQGGSSYAAASLPPNPYAPHWGNDNTTWISASTIPICGGFEDDSFGQFVGKVAGGTDYGTEYFDGYWNGGNDEAMGGSAESTYRDIFYPIYRGYMPMIYYNDGVGWRYYMQRWFHYYGKQCFFSPDYFLDPNPSIASSYWVKHVARTQDFTNDYWNHKTQADWGWSIGANYATDTRDLCPLTVLAEVITRYKCDASLLDAESCNVYEIGRVGDVYPSSPTNLYVNAGCDFTGVGIYTGTADTLWRAYKDAGGLNKQWWSNRSIRSQQYIGINTALDISTNDSDESNYRLAIVNLYNTNPNPAWVLAGTFDLLIWEPAFYTKPLYKISDYIPFFDNLMNVVLQNVYVCYKGDCFLNRFYFKQAFFGCSNFTADGADGVGTGKLPIACEYSDMGTYPEMDDPTGGAANEIKNRYSHGLIMGIVVEMKFNGNMRYSEGGTDPTYFPYVDAWDFNIWAADTYPTVSGVESQLYNMGHHRTLDERPYYFYNSAIPHTQNKHLTRIRFSDIHDQYSIIDGYRNILPLAYKDYDSRLQQIMKITEFSNTLLSIQEDSINRHYTLEKELETDIASSTIALGSGDILSDVVKPIADYGTQHQWSVVRTKNAVYGVDAYRRLIWRAKMSTTTTGSYVMSSTELNRDKFVEKWIYDWLDVAQPITDVIERIPDEPINGFGIVGGYDAKYKDVIFSFFSHINSTYSYTIMGIVAFGMMWDATVDYLNAYTIVYNSVDGLWYYSKFPIGITNNVNHQPDLFPNYWVLIDFSVMTNFTVGMTVTAGQIIRCCPATVIALDDCIGGNIYVVTVGASPVATCVSLGKTAHGFVNFNVLPIRCCEDTSKSIVFNEDLDEFVGEASYNSVIYANIYNDFFTSGNAVLSQQSYVWKHDMPDCLWFYGSNEEMKISWYENGNTDTATNSSYTKFFESQDVHSSEREFYGVIYETEYQTGAQFPFTSDTEFWRSPEYLEHHWKVPIEVKADADDQDFETDSSMQGTWLKTTLRYKSNIDTFIKNISTSYRNSAV